MIELGEKVRDKISGVEGVAVSRTQFLNGCIQYGVCPKAKKGATEIPIWNIDQQQLEVVEKKGKKLVIKKKRPLGGPTRKLHTLTGTFGKTGC